MKDPSLIRRAQSRAVEARQAVREFHAEVAQIDMELVIFFCSSEYDLEVLAEEMRTLFAGVQVVGCTTAGEIGPAGYLEHSITGASFPSSNFNAVIGDFGRLQEFEVTAGQTLTRELLQKLESLPPKWELDNRFAVLMIDGLSMREEPVTRALQNALGSIQLVGGSAGDGVKFGKTYVYFEGHFQPDSAILVLVATRFPVKSFRTQHFVATEERIVVTEADPLHRVVSEINGLPAAEEYSRILGINSHDLSPKRFASWPVVVQIDGTNYVRSIQKSNPDGSLSFFCAIENGLVLRVAKGVDLLKNLEEAFAQIKAEIGRPQFVLAFDCILRKLEVNQNSLRDRVSEIFLRNNAVGFNTYGEQFNGVHVNQTLVGIAIGSDLAETVHD